MTVPLGELLRRAARRAPGKTALVAGDETLDFAAYDRASDRFANLLVASGVEPGDRVAVLLQNSPAYGVAHFGAARAGALLVHFPPPTAPPRLAKLIARTRPRVLVVDAALDQKLTAAARRAIPTRFVVEDGATGRGSLADALAGAFDRPPAIGVDPASPAAMTFTGGTTGGPKGVVVSHRARAVAARTTAVGHRITADDVVAVVTPMCHAMGLLVWHQAAVLVGAASVLFRRWDPARFVDEVERRRISAAFLVPAQLRDLLHSPAFDRDRLATLGNIGLGGAPLAPSLAAACRKALPDAATTDHYGQSETGPLTIRPPEDAITHAGTVGRPAPGVDLRIVDEQGQGVAPGVVGEIVARGPFLMDGYHDDPAETAHYFRGDGGWGWTGDLARRDEDGTITLVGRSRDVVNSGGLLIHPVEIEAALGSHPAVADAAVFGAPDERWGEAAIACVVLRSGRAVTEAELIAHCQATLARTTRPREVVFFDHLPRTAAGKVRKNILRQTWRASRSPPPAAFPD